jgi:hypothetical protein
LCDADPTISPFPTFIINETITNSMNLFAQIAITSLTTTPSPVATYTSTVYDGTISTWSALFPARLYIFIAPTITGSTNLGHIIINSNGTFTFTTNTVTNYDSCNIAFSDNSTYANGYLQTAPYQFTTIIGNINANVSPITYVPSVSGSYTITLTNWNSSYSSLTSLYVFSATSSSFANLTLLTSSPVTITNTSGTYTVTFSATLTGSGTYYFAVSNIATPTVNTYIVYQLVNVQITSSGFVVTPYLFASRPLLTTVNPTSITGLTLWVDAYEINGSYLGNLTLTNNQTISSWVNKTGVSVYNLTPMNTSGSRNAKYITNGISNLNSIYLNNTGLLASIPANTFTNGITVFIVYKNTASDTTNVALFYRNTSSNNTPNPINVYNDSRDFSDSSTITSTFDISENSGSTIFSFSTDSTLAYNEYSNGVSNVTGNAGAYTDAGTQITIGMDGQNTVATYGFVGDISEIIIYNFDLSPLQQKDIEGYLAWKWNMQTYLPSSHPYSYLNVSFTSPKNTYIGFITPYEIILANYTPAVGYTNLYVQYSLQSSSPTSLTLISNITITQDDNNKYVLLFSAQFSSSGSYYIYLTDASNNIILSVTTPIVVTDASSLLTLTTPTPTINTSTTLQINLGGWSSIFQVGQVSIYHSGYSSDPNPTFITTANIAYTYPTYSVSFLVNLPADNYYFYIIGTNNSVQICKKTINVIVNTSNVLTPTLSKTTNYVFDPTSISSLKLWLDANQISGSYVNQPANSGSVTTWKDKSGSGYDATTTGAPTFAVSGINNLPSVVLSTGDSFVSSIPTETFTTGMTIFIVYQGYGTPSSYEGLICRNYGPIPAPFIMNNEARYIGTDGNSQTTLGSPININGNTTPSIFYNRMNPNNLSYLESNQFINIVNNTFLYWSDGFNDGNLYIGANPLSINYNGYISEVLVFNSPLSNLQKYQVEGYLAYKWNMLIYLPLYHPFSSYTPANFTPLLFDSLQVWMDASNTSSITLDGNNVTQWNDSSYNKNNATLNSSFNNIIRGTQSGLNTLVFNASVMNFANTNILLSSADASLMFLLYLPPGSITNGSSSPFSNINYLESFPYTDGNIDTSFGFSSSTDIGPISSGWSIYTIVASSSTGTTTAYINGVRVFSGTYSNTNYNNKNGWAIGSPNGSSVPMSATLAEMMVFNSALSTNTRILLEGYLANKWAVSNLVPVGSPFRSIAPTMTDYNNLLNDNLQLNLDASSSSNFTFSGSNILTWSDTSGNNNSLTSTYSNSILQTNTVNNKQGVYFNYNSMEPVDKTKLVLNTKNFTIFTAGYINNTDGKTRPTILGSDQQQPTSSSFVIAGGQGSSTVVYSSNGTTWTTSTSGNSIFGTNMQGVVWNGTMWVAVGQGSVYNVGYSYDGINWIGSASGTTILNAYGSGVGWNGIMWVIGGFTSTATSAMAYSYDGINWNSITSPFSGPIRRFAWNGTMWITAGQSSLATSTNGINWTLNTSANDLLTGQALDVAWNGSRWVAVGTGTNTIIYSADGITWTAATSANNLFTTGASIAWNGTIWIAGGIGNYRLAYSSNGIDWTGYTSVNSLIDYACLGVTWNGSMWLVACQPSGGSTDRNTMIYSSDGTNWQVNTSASNLNTTNYYNVVSKNISPYNIAYNFNIRKNTSLTDQMSVTYTTSSLQVEISANLTTTLPNGLQNLTSTSAFVNGNNIPVTINSSDNIFNSNFFLGGKSTDSNSLLQASYIHQVMVYNTNLDPVTRYRVESNLANKWNIPTSNSVANLSSIISYKGIITNFTVLLQNWTLTSVNSIYVGYNTSPDNLTNLNIIGSFTVNQKNNIYNIAFTNIFGSTGTYYLHLVNSSNVEYASISKPIIIQDLNTLITVPSTITISVNPYNIVLGNFPSIVANIGLYSYQISNFNFSLGVSSSDPSPTFVSNITVQYNNSTKQYYVQIPSLTNADLKYVYLSKTINGVTINLTPILINQTSVSLSIDRNYGILNTSNSFTLQLTYRFTNPFSTVYLYYSTIPNDTAPTFISSKSVNSSNQVQFNYTTSNSLVYFYISTESGFMGINNYVGPVTFYDPTAFNISLDTYDINTTTRNILLDVYPQQLVNLNLAIFGNNNFISTSLITQFSPLNITSLRLWLDASTNNNFTFSGSNITQWTDLSGNSNNATNSSAYPIYNTPNKGVNFTGGKYLTLPNNTIPSGDNNYHIFVVLTPTDSSSSPQFILGALDNTSSPGSNTINTFYTTTNNYKQSWNNGSDLTSSSYTIGSKQIVSFEYISSVNRTTFLNGSNIANDLPSARNSSVNNNLIGGLLGNQTFTSYIHEIIIYSNPLTVVERKKVENYLSDKWAVSLS